MPYFIDLQNKFHFLSDQDIANGGESLLPAGCVIATAAQIAAVENPVLTVAQVQAILEAQVQQYIDSKAQAKGFDNANSCISYLTSTNTVWAAEALAMRNWRDAVWSFCYTDQSSATPSTTFAVLEPLLPAAPW